MDESTLYEESVTGATRVLAGVGGKVWKPSANTPAPPSVSVVPAAPAAILPPDKLAPRSLFVQTCVGVVCGLVAVLICIFIATLAITAVVGLGTLAFSTGLAVHEELDKSSKLAAAYEHEYGYSDVKVMENSKATVTVIQTNEAKEVDVFAYKGAFILFETDGQLNDKIAEADAGTYEVLKTIQADAK